MSGESLFFVATYPNYAIRLTSRKGRGKSINKFGNDYNYPLKTASFIFSSSLRRGSGRLEFD